MSLSGISAEMIAAADAAEPALIHKESSGRADALGPVIEFGANRGDRARGLFQVMPITARDPGFGVAPAADDSFEEYERVGRDYWRAMVNRYNGDVEAAAVAFNAGPGNADKFVRAGKDYSVLPDRAQTEPYARYIAQSVEGGGSSDGTASAKKPSGIRALSLDQAFQGQDEGTAEPDAGQELDFSSITAGMLIAQDLSQDPYSDELSMALINELPEDFNPVPPGDLGEVFMRGVSMGGQNISAELARTQGAFDALLGKDEAAAANFREADSKSMLASNQAAGLQTFGEFLAEPTVDGFLEQAFLGAGQAAPSIGATVVSAFVTGGTAALTGLAGREVVKRAGTEATKKIVKDIATKKLKGEALDASEEIILKASYGTMRQAMTNFKAGAVAGAVAVDYPQMVGSVVNEYQEAGYDISAEEALKAFGAGVPLTAIGVGGEALIVNSFIKVARKKAGEKGAKSIFTRYAQDLAKGVGKGSAVEGVTEGVQEGGIVALRKTIDEDYDAQEGQLRIAQAVFTGLVAGGAVGAGGAPVATTASILRSPRERAPVDPDNPEASEEIFPGQPLMSSFTNAALAAGRMIDQVIAKRKEAILLRETTGVGEAAPSQPTADSMEDINAQFAAMHNDEAPRQAVLLPEGSPMFEASQRNNLLEDGQISEVKYEGMPSVFVANVPNVGLVVVKDEATARQAIEQRGSEEFLAGVLGFSGTKPADADRVVRVKLKDGGFISEEATNEAGERDAYARALQNPQDSVEIDIVPVEQALEERKARVEGERQAVIDEAGLEQEIDEYSDKVELRDVDLTPQDMGSFKASDPSKKNPDFIENFNRMIERLPEEDRAEMQKFRGAMSDSLLRAVNSVLDADVDGVRFTPLIEVDGDRLRLQRVPTEELTEAKERAAEFRQAILRAASTNTRDNPETQPFVVITPEGKEVAPNLSRIINAAKGLNANDKTAQVGAKLTPEQQARNGLLRAVETLIDNGYQLQIRGANAPVQLSLRELKKHPEVRNFVFYRSGKMRMTYEDLLKVEAPATREHKIAVEKQENEKARIAAIKDEKVREQEQDRFEAEKFGFDPDQITEEISKPENDPEERAQRDAEKAGAYDGPKDDIRKPIKPTEEQARRAKAKEAVKRSKSKKKPAPKPKAEPDVIPSSRLINETWVNNQGGVGVGNQPELKVQKNPNRPKIDYTKSRMKRRIDSTLAPTGYKLTDRIYNMATSLFTFQRPIMIVSAARLKKDAKTLIGEDKLFTNKKFMQGVVDDMSAGKTQGLFIPTGSVDIIIVNDIKIPDGLTKDEEEAYLGTVIAHEIGHAVFKHEFSRIAADQDLKKKLWDAYVADVKKLGKNKPSQYESSVRGFEEWYADQVAATAIGRAQKASNTAGGARKSPAILREFQQMARKLKDFFERLNKLFSGRLTKNKVFNEYLDDVVKLHKSYNAVIGLGPMPQSISFTEEAAIRDLINETDTPKNKARARRVARLTEKLMEGGSVEWLKRHLFAADDYLRSKGAGGKDLAKFFYGKSQSGESQGFHMAKNHAHNRLMARLSRALDLPISFTEKQLNSPEIRKAFEQAADETIPTSQLQGKAKRIRKFFDHIFDNYITDPDTGDKWVDVNRRTNYAPRKLDAEAIRKNKDGFRRFLLNYMDDGAAGGVIEAVTGLGDGGDPVGRPAFGSGKTRTMENVPTKDLIKAGWVLDPAHSAVEYIHHITKRVEFQKLGGTPEVTRMTAEAAGADPDQYNKNVSANVSKLVQDHGSFEAIPGEEVDAARKQAAVDAGADPKEYHHVNQAVMAQMGRLNSLNGMDISSDSTTAKVARTTNSIAATHTVLTTLAMSVFASLPDLGGIATRSKEARNLASVVDNMFKKETREEAQALAEAVGVATHEALNNMFMSAGELDHTNKFSQKITQAFFKYTGLEWYTGFVRQVATGVGRDFLLHNASHKDFDTDPRRKRYLAELGVTREQVLAWRDAGQPTHGPEFRAIRHAISRFVDESIVRPNAAQRPVWASNPWFTMMWTLKSYFYAYGKTVVGGLGREIKNRYSETGEFTGPAAVMALAAGTMLPLTMLGLGAREQTKWWARYFLPGLEANGSVFQSRHMTYPEYAFEIVDRSGVLGPFTLLTSTYSGLEREGVLFGGPISNIPILDAVDDTVFDGDTTRMIPVVNNL